MCMHARRYEMHRTDIATPILQIHLHYDPGGRMPGRRPDPATDGFSPPATPAASAS
jgi:hypothetical protein